MPQIQCASCGSSAGRNFYGALHNMKTSTKFITVLALLLCLVISCFSFSVSADPTTSSGSSSGSGVSSGSDEEHEEHNWVDNEDGTKGKHCSVCNKNYCDVVGHEQATAATCTKRATCKICGKEYGELAPHTPDDTQTGQGCASEIKCKVCGTVIKAAGQHNWAPATCTSPKHCLVCGAKEGEALMHRWGEGIITKAPTESSPGSMRYVCEDCGEIKAQAIYYSKDDEGGPGNVLLILLISVVVLSGIAAIVYFVFIRSRIRKKSKKSKVRIKNINR